MIAALWLGVVGCDAPTIGDDAGRRDASESETCDGADGTPCGDGDICVSGACVESTCGDGFVDTAAGEDCEDGNETAFDGCEPDTCRYTCVDDERCDDGNDCNGVGTCGSDHVCVPGDPLADGAACTQSSGQSGVCRAQECVEAGCGNGTVDGSEQCDDMNLVPGDGCEVDCTFSCEIDADCLDTSVCNGAETCDTSTHTCVAGTPLVCTPSDACHAASCDDTAGCQEVLIDEDGDGHAPQALGSCGDDCQDNLATRHVGHPEICGDGIDNDCDTDVDETAPTWYADCDRDTFAATPTAGTTVESCELPTSGPSFCPSGTWTMTIPAGTMVDCDDTASDVHPGGVEVTGDEIDSDCDGRELCYLDADRDFARSTSTIESSDPDCDDPMEANSAAQLDCNDGDASIHPGAAETCDGIDNDCDAATDEAPAGAPCAFGCNSTAGRCNNCPPGGRSCIDADTVQLCPDGAGWMTQVCSHGCNATRNECNVCTPNSYRCADSGHQQQCLADGSGWGAPTACGALGCEDVSYHRCRQCDPAYPTYCSSATGRGWCNSYGFSSGGVNCPVAYPGPAPDGCNPATRRCYHE